MNPEDFYHVGIVVDDLTAAMERLTAAGGYSWTKPVEYTVAITTAAGDIDVPFRFVYSLQAPHLELVQQVPGTLWTSPPGRAAHHLGYWVDDIGATAAALEAAGFELEARPAGDTLSTFAYFIDPTGMRIEIVDRAVFPDWPTPLPTLTSPTR